MTTRRRFIWCLPASGAAVLAACSDQAATPAAPAAPGGSAEYPVPAPAPAPAAPPSPPPAPAAAPAPAGSPATAAPMVDESDPTAVALSYVSDAARVDRARHTKFAPGQACASCQLYQGAGAAAGPCPLFPGKLVAATGWCSSYVPKA